MGVINRVTTEWHGHTLEVRQRSADRLTGASEYFAVVKDNKSHGQTVYLEEGELVSLLNLFRHTVGREPIR